MKLLERRPIRLLLIIGVLGCAPASPPPSMGAGSRPSARADTAASAGAAPNDRISQPSLLAISAEPKSLDIKPIDWTTYIDLTSTRSSDGVHALESRFDKFVVRSSGARRVVLEAPGAAARWVSPTEIVFLDPTGGTYQLVKVDVTAPSKKLRGGYACSGPAVCERGQPPELAWVSSDLAHAIATPYLSQAFYDVRPTETVRIPDPPTEQGDVVLATGFGKNGAVCMFVGAPTERPTASKGHLYAIEQPWTSWRHLRDLAVDGPIYRHGGVHVRFFSENAVILSLPSPEDLSEGVVTRYVHCVVKLDTGDARCTNARPEWAPLGDGRWVIESTVLLASPARLIDVAHGRSWAIGDATTAFWWDPRPNAKAPNSIVLGRRDKSDVQAGTVVLPASDVGAGAL